MKTTKLLKLLLAVPLFSFCSGFVSAQPTTIVLTENMVSSVTAFLNGLSSQQRDTATYNFNDEERLNWHFIPRSRNGLSFNDMNEAQRQLAGQVMTTFLSARGYEKISQIRGHSVHSDCSRTQ